MPAESTHANCLDIALPGYTLSDQLGAGGYGEVWRATAPGGLAKAVKFVFGHYNEKRATRELRALEKIKEVRHPFLLSLERIEVLEDRLVIITELAEGSLKDRFDQCQAEGLPGIARDELLRYLRDAADALDFLSREHSLQHLDVKPENLLLLAGHVKVADFGLVKDVANSQASLVGGLTPLYAAPEVFQGRPSAFSDQYSLAILYQEMLTGAAPFDGVTAAELTMQHLRDEPNLSPLPAADRYTLARALAKDIERRFANCGEFIAALTAGGSQWQTAEKIESGETESKSSPAAQPASPTPRRSPVTEAFDGPEDGPLGRSIVLDSPVQAVQSTVLPPPPTDPQSFHPCPALVIGIGGVGGNVLCEIRRQLTARLGDYRRAPALATLLLECDQKAILAATRSDRPGALRADETLSLALRRPQDYRDRSEDLQQWLSRRWLYNIPKSLNTEGLRPLGRLALIDHLMQTVQRIRLAATAAATPEVLTATADATGLQYRSDALRIYVVAAASGGLGSGAAIDLGYAIRTVLEKLPFVETTTLGLFTHSLGTDQRSSELARVNAYSWLTELLHVMQPDFAYPGDPSGNLPAFPAGVAPYDHSYLVQLANGLDSDGWRAEARQVADYVLLDTLTPVQTALDASRAARPAETTPLVLRSFGVQPMASAPPAVVAEAARRVVQRVVKDWRGKKPRRETVGEPQISEESGVEAAPSSAAAMQLADALSLSLPQITTRTRGIIEARLGTQLEQAYLATLADLRDQQETLTTHLALQAADEFFAPPQAASSRLATYVADEPIAQVMAATAVGQSNLLRQQLIGLLDEPSERLAGAEAAVAAMRELLKTIRREASDLETEIHRDIRAAAERVLEIENSEQIDPRPPEEREELFAYLRRRLDGAAVHAAGALIDALVAAVKEVAGDLRELSRHLDTLMRCCDAAVSQAVAERVHLAEEGSPGVAIDSFLKSRLNDLAAEVSRVAYEHLLAPQGGLAASLVGDARFRATLLETLQEEAIAIVQRRLSEQSLGGACQPSSPASDALTPDAASADPALLRYGGGVQRLAVVPEANLDASRIGQLSDHLGGAGVLPGRHIDYVYCCEAQQIPVVAWALDTIQKRRDYAEFAKRVHTRSDIDWTPLYTGSPRESDAALPLAASIAASPASPATQSI